MGIDTCATLKCSAPLNNGKYNSATIDRGTKDEEVGESYKTTEKVVKRASQIPPIRCDFQEEDESKYTPPNKHRLTPFGLVIPGQSQFVFDYHASSLTLNNDVKGADYSDCNNRDNESTEWDQSLEDQLDVLDLDEVNVLELDVDNLPH